MAKRAAGQGILARIAEVMFGLFLCAILLELGLRAAGFVFLYSQDQRNKVCARQKGAYRIMCLGESNTALGGVYSYPSQLQEILNRRGTGVKFSVINKGLPEIHTSDILNRLESDLDAYRPDMVIAMMGINERGTYMFRRGPSGSRAIDFLKSLKVYKLPRIIFRNIVTARRQGYPSKSGTRQERSAASIPGNDGEYAALGIFYRDKGKFAEAEDAFSKAMELNPRNYRAYIEQGWICRVQGRFSEAEGLLNKAIGLDPANDGPYMELGWIYRIQGKFPEAEAAFRKAIEINPKNYWPYVERGNFAGAEAVFRKAIELNPKDDWAYIGLGWIYHDQGRIPEAEAAFKKAREINPQNIWLQAQLGQFFRDQNKVIETEAVLKKGIEVDPLAAGPHLELGWVYQAQGRLSEAEAAFKKAIELEPENHWPYFKLGRFYMEQGKIFEAETAFRKALEVNPQADCPYLELGWIYRSMGKLTEAEAIFKKAIEANPRNNWAYGALSALYVKTGDLRLARECDRKSRELKEDCLPQIVIEHYRKLKAVLDKRGVVFVCAQYPLRSLEPLKKIFRDGPEGIIFVDNQKIFRDALIRGGYAEYFIDMFAGDFGHCTPKGNRLLAENIANAILDRVFSVKGGIDAARTRERP
ncbi:MAG: tetratricopeptide repeat protein [Candidatus Omnitrophica bacterium]|nr:tetratricopeptide repeat protein [Candidatus Omnitrophota bacterium]